MLRGHSQNLHGFGPFYHWQQPPKCNFGGFFYHPCKRTFNRTLCTANQKCWKVLTIYFCHEPDVLHKSCRTYNRTNALCITHIVRNSIWLKKNRASDNEGKFHSFLMWAKSNLIFPKCAKCTLTLMSNYEINFWI